MNRYFKKTIFLFSVVCCLLSIFAFSANIVFAADCTSNTETGSIFQDMKDCRDCGDCTLNDFARIAINISNFILGIVGSLALLFFIYGGVIFLISSGSQEKVTQAKQIIVGAVIGIVIVFTSYMIINFVASALGIQGGILQSDWFK